MKTTKILCILISALLMLPCLAVSAADFPDELALSSQYDYLPGERINVSVTLNSVKTEGGVCMLYFELYYDASAVTPAIGNDYEKDNAAMDAFLTSAPDESWESLCRLSPEKGRYDISVMTCESASAASEDGDVSLTIPFIVNEDASEAISFYIGDSYCTDYNIVKSYGGYDSCVLVLGSKPSAPVAEQLTSSSILLVSSGRCEYRCVGEDFDSGWQREALFENLTAGETYTVTARYIGIENPEESDSLTVTLPFDVIELNEGSPYAIDEQTLTVTGIRENTSVSEFLCSFTNANVLLRNPDGSEVTGAYVGTGMQIVITNKSGETVDRLDALVMGDVTGDGEIDPRDYLAIKRAFLGTVTMSGINEKAACIMSDRLSACDYTLVKRHCLNTFDIYSLN